MKLGESFAKVIEKLGLDITDESYKDILASQLDVPETLSLGIDKLMTEEGAKSNPVIKKHYLDNMANGQNKSLDIMASEHGLSQEERDEIFQNNKTVSDKTKAILAKVAEKGKGKDKPDTDSKAIIEKLNADLKKQREDYESEKNQLLSKFEQDQIDEYVSREFLSKNWSSAFPEDMRGDIARIALQKELEQKGISIVKDGKSIKLVRSDNKDQDYFDETNKKITFTELRDNIFAAKNFGSVSPDTPHPVVPPVQTAAQTQTRSIDPRISAAFAQSKADQNMQ